MVGLVLAEEPASLKMDQWGLCDLKFEEEKQRRKMNRGSEKCASSCLAPTCTRWDSRRGGEDGAGGVNGT